jgi:hypothetical protein
MSRKIKYNGARVSRREHGQLAFRQIVETDGRDETESYTNTSYGSRQSFVIRPQLG